MNCDWRETFEEEDANGVRKVKGIFCRAKKETAKEQLLVTRGSRRRFSETGVCFIWFFLIFSLILFFDFFYLLRGACVIHMCVFHLWL